MNSDIPGKISIYDVQDSRVALLVWGRRKDDPPYLEDLLSDKCKTADDTEAIKLAAAKDGYVNFRTSEVFI